MADFTMNVGQKVLATETPNGTLASGDVPVWSTSDPTIASIAPSTDGTTCEVTGVAPGTITLACNAQSSFADTNVSDHKIVQIGVPAATALTISFGTAS